MKRAGFWTKDWFLGLAVAVVLVLCAGSDLIQRPMLFELGDPRVKPDRPLPDYVTRNALGAVEAAAPELPFPTSASVTYPIDLVGRHTAGIGQLNARIDVGGAVRSELLALAHST